VCTGGDNCCGVEVSEAGVSSCEGRLRGQDALATAGGTPALPFHDLKREEDAELRRTDEGVRPYVYLRNAMVRVAAIPF